MSRARRIGHYAIGARDGGSEWHIGSLLQECSQGCRRATSVVDITGVDAIVNAERARLRAVVEDLPEPTLGLRGGVSRAAVLALLVPDGMKEPQ